MTMPIASASLKVAPDTAPNPKLIKSAQEFESILLANWLEKMQQSFVGEEQSQDAAHDSVASLGTQAVASALAARGGIGIAHMLLQQIAPGIQAQPHFAPGKPTELKLNERAADESVRTVSPPLQKLGGTLKVSY